MANIKDKTLESARWAGADVVLSDGGSRGAGRLLAKITGVKVEGSKKPATQVRFYFSYFDAAKARRYFPIGDYGKGKGQYTLIQARGRAAELSALYQQGTDLHAHFEGIQAEAERQRKAAEKATEEAERRAGSDTLRELLTAYSDFLKRAGKQSAGDVAGIFRLHVLDLDAEDAPKVKNDTRPRLASRRASDISPDDFVALLAALTKAGKGRTAAKLRSYLRAAYSLAITAKTDPDAPLELRTFGIEVNPIASIGAMSKYNRARERNLSAEELRAFLGRLEALPQTVKKDALNLCLLLGGQRPTQLLRVKPVDADLSAGSITLFDGKGRRHQPRPHVLPLTVRASAIVKRTMGLRGECPTIFSSNGKKPLHPDTLGDTVAEMSAAMVKAKEAREGFELRDLRRTCETMLAGLRVSKDLRGQLQSHGLGGVQDRHYDKYGYMLEKRQTLEKWQRQLDRIAAGKVATVQQLPKRTGKAA